MTTPSYENSITLYHGTGSFYQGSPTIGRKDVLRTGYPSMTGDLETARTFAGGSRDSRVYSIDIPRSEILDMTEESAKLGDSGDWEELRRRIIEAANSGPYKAVAIHDITSGSDEPEYRLIGHVDSNEWKVEPIYDEQLDELNDIIHRFNSGEKISRGDRNRTRRLNRELGLEDQDIIEMAEELSEEKILR